MSISNFILCYWAVWVLNVSIDGFCYLFTGAMVNLILAIPLIIQRLPIKFTPEFEELYEKNFNVLSRFEFKKIKEITNMRIKRRIVEGTQICMENNPFEAVYLFSKIPEGTDLHIMMKGTKLEKVREGQWFGVVEFMEYERVLEKFNRGCDANGGNPQSKCYKALGKIKYQASLQITKMGNDPIEFIELDADLIKLIREEENGQDYMNAMRTLWLKQYMKSIQKMDKEL